jgi:hypothetical protein
MSRRVGNDNSLQLSHFTVDTSIRRGHPRWFRASPSRPDFTPEEAAAAAAASGLLAEGVRRAILTSAIAQQETLDAPGLVLLDAANRVDAVTPAARHWLGELLFDEELPSVVHALATTPAAPAAPGPLQPAQARARARGERPGTRDARSRDRPG